MLAPIHSTPVGYGVDMIITEGKFGLRDDTLKTDLLAAVYDLIEQHAQTSLLRVYKDAQIGIYCALRRQLLVPVECTEIYLTRDPHKFVVYKGQEVSLHTSTALN